MPPKIDLFSLGGAVSKSALLLLILFVKIENSPLGSVLGISVPEGVEDPKIPIGLVILISGSLGVTVGFVFSIFSTTGAVSLLLKLPNLSPPLNKLEVVFGGSCACCC